MANLRKKYFVSADCSERDWTAYSARCLEMLKVGGTIELSFEHWNKAWYVRVYSTCGGWHVKMYPVTIPGIQMRVLILPERIRTSANNVLVEVKGLAAEFGEQLEQGTVSEEEAGKSLEEGKAPFQVELEKIKTGEWVYEKVEPLQVNSSEYIRQTKEGYKICNTCNKELPLSEYYIHHIDDGILVPMPYCKECRKARERRRRLEAKRNRVDDKS